MSRFIFFTLILALFSAAAEADQIRVGGVLYREVYIKKDNGYYYIHHPTEGRVEKVSRKRRDVEELAIDEDEGEREKILKAFNASKQKRALERNSTAVAKPLDSAEFLERQALRTLALFETQLNHWYGLSPVEREQILVSLRTSVDQNIERRTDASRDVQSKLGSLHTEKDKYESKVQTSQSKRDRAVGDADRESASDIFMEEYEKSIVRNNIRGGRFYGDHWREAAETESVIQNRKRDSANRIYNKEIQEHERSLNHVDSAITAQELELGSIKSKLSDALRRASSFQARIDELLLAEKQGYESQLRATSVVSLDSDKSQRSQVFEVPGGLWRIECLREDRGVADGFAIVIVDEKGDSPFTRIGDLDFLRMRARVFDRPGKYYIEVEQGSSGVPYEISIQSLSKG